MFDEILTDKNIEKFSDKLGQNEIYSQVSFVVNFMTESYSAGECYRFLRNLEPLLNQSRLSPDLQKKYQELLAKLKFVALHMLEVQEVEDLFKGNLLYAFRNEMDLQKPVHMLLENSRDSLNLKSNLAQAINSNQEMISGSSVANWLKEYKSTIGDTAPGTLELVKFITENKKSSQLDPDSKEILKNMLSFYDWLNYRAVDVTQALGIGRKQFSAPIKSDIPRQTFNTSAPNVSVPTPSKAELTAFEKRLAEVEKEPKVEEKNNNELDALKKRIESAKVQRSVGTVPPPPKNDQWQKELNRELLTPELTGQVTAMKDIVKPTPVVAIPKPAIRPTSRIPHVRPQGVPISDINSIEDLRKIDVRDLRRGGQVEGQIDVIKAKILALSRENNVMPFYAVAEFEQSPLYKSYLASGSAFVAGSKGELSLEEFEAVADLKKEIEQL